MGIAPHDTAHHYKDTPRVRQFDETAQGIAPGRQLAALFKIEPQCMANILRCCHHIACHVHRTYESERLIARRAGKVPIPFLALLADINGVEQVRTQAVKLPGINSAEIRNWHPLHRGLRQEEVADWRMGGFGEAFQLF